MAIKLRNRPQLTQSAVVRSLPELHLPDLDLSGLERPKLELPDAIANHEWPKVDLPSFDLDKAIAGVAAAAHVGRRPRRSRWPLAVVGLGIAGLVGWAVVSQESLRVRLTRAADVVGERISALRSDLQRRSEVRSDHPIAFSAAETAPLEPSPFAVDPTHEATDYPAGLGSDSGFGTATPDEVLSRT